MLQKLAIVLLAPLLIWQGRQVIGTRHSRNLSLKRHMSGILAPRFPIKKNPTMPNTAPATQQFSDVGLNNELLKSLKEAGYQQMTPVQAMSLPLVLRGDDVVVQDKRALAKPPYLLWGYLPNCTHFIVILYFSVQTLLLLYKLYCQFTQLKALPAGPATGPCPLEVVAT